MTYTSTRIEMLTVDDIAITIIVIVKSIWITSSGTVASVGGFTVVVVVVVVVVVAVVVVKD